MFTVADLIKGIIVSLTVSVIIRMGNSFIASFKEKNKDQGSKQTVYTDADISSMKLQFKIVFFLAVGVAVTLLVIKPEPDNPLAGFLYMVGFLAAFLTFTTFYCLDDVIKQLRKQIGNQPAQDAANDTSNRDISA